MVSITAYVMLHRTQKLYGQILAVVVFGASTIIACTYKRNTLIYVIAVLLITATAQLRKIRPILVAVVAVTALISMSATGVTTKYYEYYANNTCGKGIPVSGWIAMGLQENSEENIPGGWNGFHSNTYIEIGYDHDASDEIFKESIRSSLDTFYKDPAFAADFFYNKTLRQWANQTHGIWWRVNSYFDVSRDESAFWVQFLNTGRYRELLPFMDLHESMVYGVLLIASVSLLMKKIKKQEIPIYMLIPFVTFIGGFLFSVLWEAQTDSVLSYPVLLLPVAVAVWSDTDIVNLRFIPRLKSQLK